MYSGYVIRLNIDSCKYTMSVAIVTGITGQDGSYLAELLLEKNYKVVGIARRSSTSNRDRIQHILSNPNLILREADLGDVSSLRSVFTEFAGSPRIEVYNLAAQSHVHTSFRQPEYTADIDAIGPLRIPVSYTHLTLPTTSRV